MTEMPNRNAAEEQIIKVKTEVQKRIDAGDLDPTEVGDELDRLVRNSPSKE